MVILNRCIHVLKSYLQLYDYYDCLFIHTLQPFIILIVQPLKEYNATASVTKP